MPVIGIDLGTTFSAVAYIDDIGRPVILRDAEGHNITPSCVTEANGRIVVGQNAQIKSLIELDDSKNEGRAGARFKRLMGHSERHQVGSQMLTPTELSTLVLKKLAHIAETQLGEVTEAVVTIPANFAHEAREATLQAARKAGLNVRSIINEPTAAALFYAHEKQSSLHGHYAVFDLGGGTFDVSIININGENVDVKASSGVSRLGGDDFDIALTELVAKKFETQTGSPMAPDDFGREDAERLKKALSTMEATEARVGRRDFIQVTRSEFEEEISGLLAQVQMHCESALEEAGLSTSDVNGVFMAGGSCRVPAVRNVAQKAFDQEPVETANLDEVVALGAALYSASKADRSSLNPAQSRAVSGIGLNEIAAYCFGTLSIGVDRATGQQEMQNSVLIKKGDAIPCKVTETFYTVANDQRDVALTVTSCTTPETDPDFTETIWEGNLPLPPGRPQGQEIQVSFSIDDNGSMHCHFKDVASGQFQEVDINESIKKEMEESEVEAFQVD